MPLIEGSEECASGNRPLNVGITVGKKKKKKHLYDLIFVIF